VRRCVNTPSSHSAKLQALAFHVGKINNNITVETNFLQLQGLVPTPSETRTWNLFDTNVNTADAEAECRRRSNTQPSPIHAGVDRKFSTAVARSIHRRRGRHCGSAAVGLCWCGGSPRPCRRHGTTVTLLISYELMSVVCRSCGSTLSANFKDCDQ